MGIQQEIKTATAYQALAISCDDCGNDTQDWDWSASYDRCCSRCLGREEDAAADHGCWEYHQGAGR